MPTEAEYRAKIAPCGWAELRTIWAGIQAGDTPGWEPGKAFEYLVLRAFELDGADVRWPYTVALFGEDVDQIDGALHCDGLSCLVESKDLREDVSLGPIAKLRYQLLRRPAGTIGLLFSSRGFTQPAVMLAHFALPQAILLWSGNEIDHGLTTESWARLLGRKFRACRGGAPGLRCTERGDIMSAYLFVAEDSDACILKHLIPATLAPEVQIVSAKGMGSLASVARTALATRRKPAAVIVDAYSVKPEVISDRRQNLEDLIWLVAGRVPVKVVMAVPELRRIFFDDPRLLPKLLGRELPAEALIRARYEPGAVLKELLAQDSRIQSIEQLVAALSPEDFETLKSAPPIPELNQFLNDVLKPAAAAKPAGAVS
jgi:hypothetical protein